MAKIKIRKDGSWQDVPIDADTWNGISDPMSLKEMLAFSYGPNTTLRLKSSHRIFILRTNHKNTMNVHYTLNGTTYYANLMPYSLICLDYNSVGAIYLEAVGNGITGGVINNTSGLTDVYISGDYFSIVTPRDYWGNYNASSISDVVESGVSIPSGTEVGIGAATIATVPYVDEKIGAFYTKSESDAKYTPLQPALYYSYGNEIERKGLIIYASDYTERAGLTWSGNTSEADSLTISTVYGGITLNPRTSTYTEKPIVSNSYVSASSFQPIPSDTYSTTSSEFKTWANGTPSANTRSNIFGICKAGTNGANLHLDNLFTAYDYYFPAKSGTFALTSDLPAVSNGTLTIKTKGTTKGTFTANQSGDTEVNITAADLGLSGAMRFIGRTTSGITDGSDMQTVLIDGAGTTAQAGDVVLKGNKEFIWTGSAWEELGDEQSHALKSVTITGSGLLEGGGSLEASRAITHKKVTTASTTSNEDKSSGGSFTAIDGIATDGYGHVTSVNTKTVSVGNTTYSLSVTNATDTSGASITLTPSSGDAQTVKLETVYNAKSADKATHDADGNIISSTYVKKTSEQLLSGWAQTFATYLNKEAYPNGIPYMSSSESKIYSELIGGYATLSALDYLKLYNAKKQSVTLNEITTDAGRTYAVMRDADSNLVVNVPWTDTAYTLPLATESTLGGIKTTFTGSGFGLTFTNGSSGIKLVGEGSGIQFAGKNYRITDIETGSISFGSETFTAGTSISKSVTFRNTNYYSSSGTLTTGNKYGTVHVYLQFVGYNGEDITCGLINLSDTGFTAYAKCQYSTLSANSTRYIHWIKVREY